MKKRVVAALVSLTLSMVMFVEAGAAAFDDAPVVSEASADLFADNAADMTVSEEITEIQPEEENVPEVTEPAVEDVVEITPSPETEPEILTEDVVPETETVPEEVIPEVTPEVIPEVIPEATPSPETEVPEVNVDIFTSEPEDVTEETVVPEEDVLTFEDEGETADVLEAETDDLKVVQDKWEKVDGNWKLGKNSDPGAYFTKADGLVEITTFSSTGTQLAKGKYLFDDNGNMITGQMTMTVGLPGYTSAANSEYYFINSTNAKLSAGITAGTEATPYNSNLGQALQTGWVWTGKTFRYYSNFVFVSVDELKASYIKAKTYTGYYNINGYNYCLTSDGTPRVGIVNITDGKVPGEYCFKDAANSVKGIPGEMVLNEWTIQKDSKGVVRWRFYKSNGLYNNRGIIATTLDSRLDPSVGNDTYLIDGNGYLIKGKMKKAANKRYYITDKTGRVYKNQVVKSGKYRYYVDETGKRVTWKNGWYRCPGAANRYYYFGKTAGRIVQKKGWQKIVVKNKMQGWFYFPKSGNHYVNKLTKNGNYFKADGSLASGITKIDGKRYFFRISTSTERKGKMYKNTWINHKNKWYYAGSDGVLYTNCWKKIDDTWYFFKKNSAVKTNSFKKKNGVNGYLDSRGRYCTGWVVRDNSKNLVSFVDRKGSGFVKNASRKISGKTYYFDENGYRINDISKIVAGPYSYVEVDRINCVMTVYKDSSKDLPIKSIRISVGNPISLTPKGKYTLKRSGRWVPLMGPSWGQYGTHVYGCGYGGIFVHSIACSYANSYNLPAGEYRKLGSPASHGCIRACVADAKFIYDNCDGARIRIFDGKSVADDACKGPLGKPALTPLRGSGNFDPTDPEVP